MLFYTYTWLQCIVTSSSRRSSLAVVWFLVAGPEDRWDYDASVAVKRTIYLRQPRSPTPRGVSVTPHFLFYPSLFIHHRSYEGDLLSFSLILLLYTFFASLPLYSTVYYIIYNEIHLLAHTHVCAHPRIRDRYFLQH